MGPTGFGEVARSYSLGMAVAQLTMASISPALSYVVGRAGDENRNATARTALRFIVVTTAGVSLLYVPLAFAGFAPTSATSLVLGPLLAFIYAAYFGIKLQLFVLDEVPRYAGAELAADAIFFSTLAALAIFEPSAGLLSFVVAYGLFVLVLGAFIRRRSAARAPVSARDEVASYASLSFVGGYSTVARFPLIVGLTGLLASNAESGRIAAIFAIVMPLFLVPQAASMLTFATVARAGDRREDKAVREMTTVVTLISTLALLVCALFAEPLVELVLGEGYESAATAFVIIAVGLAPALASLPVGNAISAEGNVGLNAAIALLGLPVAVIAAVILIPPYGLEGAAIAITVSHVAMGCALLVVGRRRYALVLADFAVGLAIVLCGIAAVALDVGDAVRVALLVLALAGLATRIPPGYIGRTT